MSNSATQRAARLPAVLFDAVSFGWSLDLLPVDRTLIAAFRGNLVRQGVVRKGSDAQRIRLAVPVGDGGRLGDLHAEIVLAGSGDRARFRTNSSIDLNLMRMLRKDLGLPPVLDALDGNDNCIGPAEGHVGDLLGRQLAFVGQAFDALAACVNDALPDGAGCDAIRVWLRSAEVCSDISVNDAQLVCRWLQRSGFPGAIAARTDLYRSSADYRDGAHSVRYWRQQDGPAAKIYAKTPRLLRAEVVCKGRKAVRTLGCDLHSDDVDGGDAKELLVRFGQATEGLHADLVAHARAAATGRRSIGDLLTSIASLIDLAAETPRGRGRTPGPKAREAASRALEDLFTHGFCDASGQRQGTALRVVLDGLCGPSGPLVRRGRRAVFSLRPEFARAADAIAQRV